MTIEKLPSGHYRITQKSNGKRYRMTIDHKPTPAEAAQIVSAMVCKSVPSADMTFQNAAESYIESRLNVISPSTERGYKSMMRGIPDTFKGKRLRQIERQDVQRLINEHAADHSPKSVRNLSGFVSAVLKYHGAHMDPITLPQKEKEDPYIPSDEEVTRIFSAVEGTVYEVPIILAARGLRLSEICALTIDDLDGNILHINKAKVRSEDGYVIKGTKTTDSKRDVTIPDYVVMRIREQGYIYNGYPNQIYKCLMSVQDKLNIPHFSLHKLRHFWASYLHYKGFPSAFIREDGGWKTDAVMKTVYQHALKKDETRKRAADEMAKLFPAAK